MKLTDAEIKLIERKRAKVRIKLNKEYATAIARVRGER